MYVFGLKVPADSWNMVIDVIPQLTNLLNYSDQKSIAISKASLSFFIFVLYLFLAADLALLALSRLVENVYEESKLQQICSHGVIPHIFRLLTSSVSKSSYYSALLIFSFYSFLILWSYLDSSSPSASLSSSPSTSPSGSLSGGMGGLGALNSTVITLRLTANIARGSPQLTLQLLQEGKAKMKLQTIGQPFVSVLGLGQVLHNMLSSSTLISEPSPHPSPAGSSPNSFSPGSSPKITRSVEVNAKWKG